MSPIRFNIQQLLMLFVLIGLIGGLLSAIIGRSYRIEFSTISANEERIALGSDVGMIAVDLNRKRFGKFRPFSNSSYASFIRWRY